MKHSCSQWPEEHHCVDCITSNWHTDAWYERPSWLVASMFVTYWGLYPFIGLQSSTLLSALSLSGYIAAWILDWYTTMDNESLRPEYDRRGLFYPCDEENWLLPRKLTWKTLIVSWPTVVTIMAMPFVYWIPLMGIAFSVIRLLVSLGNARKTRLMRVLIRKLEERRYPTGYLPQRPI